MHETVPVISNGECDTGKLTATNIHHYIAHTRFSTKSFRIFFAFDFFFVIVVVCFCFRCCCQHFITHTIASFRFFSIFYISFWLRIERQNFNTHIYTLYIQIRSETCLPHVPFNGTTPSKHTYIDVYISETRCLYIYYVWLSNIVKMKNCV